MGQRDARGGSPRRRGGALLFPGALASAVILAGLAGGAAFWRFAHTEKAGTVESWRVRLSATADDRMAAIEEHLEEVHRDGRVLAGFPILAAFLKGGKPSPGEAPFPEREEPKRHLQDLLSRFSEAEGYEGIVLLDGEGETLLSTPGAPPLPEACRSWAGASEFRDVRARFFACPEGGVLLVHAFPLSSFGKPAELPPLLFLVEKPDRRLYPLLAREPAPTASGEVFLVRREGGRVRFLSPLRFSSKPFLEATLSYDRPGLAAREALMGRETFGEFRDYRGAPVFAATRRIAGTPWGLVAKVDREEVFGPWRERMALEGASAALLYLLLAGSVWVFARRQRHRYLESLEAAERFSAALLDSLPGVVYCYDETFRFRRWNAAFERVTGYSADEIETMKPLDFFPEEERALVSERIGGVFRTGSGSVEAHFLTKDGRRIPFHFTGVRALLEGKPHLVGVGIDVSQRARALGNLRESEARYRALSAELEGKVRERTAELRDALKRMVASAEEAEIAHDLLREKEELLRLALEGAGAGTWEWRPGRASVHLGPLFQRIVGVEAKELSLEDFLALFDPTARDPLFKGMAAALLENRPFGLEARLCGEKPRWFLLRGQGIALQTAGGRFIGLALDVTERKEAEEALRRQAEEIAALNQGLQAANAELEAFSYSVSHDLRAPLRALDGFSQALEEDFGGALGESGKDYLRRIRSAAQRMALLIDDLLRLSRVSRAELRREEVDLSALARDVLAELLCREPGREVEVSVEEGLMAEGDPRLLRVVLENLLGNALKYTSKKERARIAFRREGEGFAVEDNGTGFDMRFSDKLFTPFQRLHSPQDFPGTGVGLALVRRILRRHGGEVWARGEPDRGAVFRFTLGSSEREGGSCGTAEGTGADAPPNVP